MQVLEFEKPIFDLRARIEELKELEQEKKLDFSGEIRKIKAQIAEIEKSIFSELTAWQKTQVARHSQRISTLDFIDNSIKDFIELQGDRCFRDDPSIIGGFGTLGQLRLMIVGHQKGKNTAENVKRNFGMPYPEGFRKALRLMELANRFSMPILTFIDTPGAYPGTGAEERGQSYAIANNLLQMAGFEVPIISVVLGEGGSGGALALGVSNRILMLEHAIYSVISPEGCAGILWKDRAKAEQAAESLQYTAQNLFKLEVIDDIIQEPAGAAHSNTEKTAENIAKKAEQHFLKLQQLSPQDLVKDRYQKFRKIGQFKEN